MIYFDNSATTNFKPAEVIGATLSAIKYLSANPGRGSHSMSAKAGLLVYKTRAKLAAFLGGVDEDRIIFTQNCTMALNMAILGSVKQGGHVVTTAYEHNSVLRPLFELERKGQISVTVLKPNGLGFVDADMVSKALQPNTYLVAVNHVSNVTGVKTPIKDIGKLTRSRNILLLTDGAQSVGYDSVSLDDNYIDMLTIAPHKGLHAVQGVGVLVLGRRVDLKPVYFGGTGTSSESVFHPRELPEALESGTVNTPGIASLNAAVSWNEKNRIFMKEKISELCAFIYEELSQTENITLYTPKNTLGGIVAFNAGSLTSVEVSTILSEQYDICTRSGLHCAPLIHKHLGTLGRGIVRVSPGFESTYAHARDFVSAIKEIVK